MHDLRILTLNCWNGRADGAAIARCLAERSVDVACFQELAPAQARAIQQVLPFGKLEPAGDHSGMGIATRFPVEAQRIALRRRDARVAVLDPLDWPQLPAPIEVVNVHLQAPHVRPWFSLPLRRDQVDELCGWLASHRPAHRVLVGDLNATPAWPAYRRLTDVLDDGALECANREGRAPAPTWGPFPSAPRMLRIDHILTSGSTLRSCEVLGTVGSDHSGVLGELDLDDEAAGGEAR